MLNKDRIVAAKYSSVSSYERNELEDKIVHIGFGAFHRGHQAVYTDLANDISDNKWGIFEINMFGPDGLVQDLQQQDHLFTVIETSTENTCSRLVRCITGSLHTPVHGILSAIDKMIEKQVAIVSLTITEKGYCIDPKSKQLDLNNPLIKHDLENPSQPISAIGLITEAIRVRNKKGLPPFSVMSCDNIPENGILTKNAVLAFAQKLDPMLAIWIAENVTFPSTMVDRIVPAMTSEQFDVIESLTGYKDPCGVVTEDFRQWVIEDNFVAGCPDWSKSGAMLVADVVPYEEMKLRMLNGTHSFLAYNGSLSGYTYIYECMQDKALREVAYRLMTQEQAKSLNPYLKVDIEKYAANLIKRFANVNVKHQTNQIAQDGSQKLPQRALDPFMKLQSIDIEAFCLPVLVAGWMHYVIQLISNEEELVDPMVEQFKEIVNIDCELDEKAQKFLCIDAIFGDLYTNNEEFKVKVMDAFVSIKDRGIHSVIVDLAE